MRDSLPDTHAVLRDLNRAKVAFQMHSLATVMGCPSIIRDVDGDGLMLTVEPLQFIQPDGSPAGSAGADPLSGSGAQVSPFHSTLIAPEA